MQWAAVAAALLTSCSCRHENISQDPDPDPVEAGTMEEGVLYTYTFKKSGTIRAYDEMEAVACIQGILNREKPRLYLLNSTYDRPQYWLDKFYSGWIGSPKKESIKDFDELLTLALSKIKGAIIWDPKVPATINVATTMAGIEDAIVFSPEMAKEYCGRYGLEILKDFRGQFDGSLTGSAKNDAYRWAKEEFLDKGKCSTHLMCLYEDSYLTRNVGDLSYVSTRDWAVCNRAFVYDLSPWGNEKPKDDPEQPMGLDLETYRMILESQLRQTAGREMTEVAGFFSFRKYSNQPGYPSIHGDVETEWENVYVISEYNCYQNTVASSCYNQSFHSKAPQKTMKQGRPETLIEPQPGKNYICILMADYDSTTPLYEFLPAHWSDRERGSIPLLWGLNPNLCETYPDIFEWLYSTRAEGDYFASDASAAGYMNPNRIREEYMQLFVEHNRKFFDQWDMSIAPMVLDTDEPTAAVKDAFTQFAPDGFATIVIDHHGTGGKHPEPQVWKGMPVMQLINDCCNFSDVENAARTMSKCISTPADDTPRFYFFRVVWTSPSNVKNTIERLRELRPELDLEVLDGYNFFNCFKTVKSRQS